jgi:surface protein
MNKNKKKIIFFLVILLAFTGLVIGIVFYKSPANTKPSKGPILDFVCKDKVKNAVNAVNSRCTSEKQVLEDKLKPCNDPQTGLQACNTAKQDLQDKLKKCTDEKTALQGQCSNEKTALEQQLQEQCTRDKVSLSNDYKLFQDDMISQYNALQGRCNSDKAALQGQYDTLQGQYDALQGQYDSEKTGYKSDLEACNSKYNTLYTNATKDKQALCAAETKDYCDSSNSCQNLKYSNTNCGACGNSCSTGYSCYSSSCVDDEKVFIIECDFTGASLTTIGLPISKIPGKNYGIDWGDTIVQQNGTFTHTYSETKPYTIRLYGKDFVWGFDTSLMTAPVTNYPGIQYITKIKSFGDNPSITALKFGGMSILTDVPNNLPIGITDCSYMFERCHKFNSENISDWDVSNVTNMLYMFRDCFEFNQNLGNWNVSKVVTNASRAQGMEGMFFGCSKFNGRGLSNWWKDKISQVTNMRYMFYNCIAFDENLSNWSKKISQVTNMSYMFYIGIRPLPTSRINKTTITTWGWDINAKTTSYMTND